MLRSEVKVEEARQRTKARVRWGGDTSAAAAGHARPISCSSLYFQADAMLGAEGLQLRRRGPRWVLRKIGVAAVRGTDSADARERPPPPPL